MTRRTKSRGMSDAALIRFATEFRAGILDGDPSDMMCFAVCAPLASMLRLSGVETELVESDLGEVNHYWLRLADGRVLDPTADQFNWCNTEQLPPVYLGPPTKLHLNIQSRSKYPARSARRSMSRS